MAQRGSSAGGGRSRRADLVSRRKALGYTQERIAHELAVDVSTVARWERGRTGPLASMRPELARLLEVSPAELAELIDGLPVPEPVPSAADGLLDTAWTSQHIGEFRDGVRTDAAPAVTAAEADRFRKCNNTVRILTYSVPRIQWPLNRSGWKTKKGSFRM